MTAEEKLNEILLEKGRGAKAKLAKFLDVSPVYVTRWATDDKYGIPKDKITLIEDFYKLPAGYLLGNENKIQIKQVKVIGSASCGDPVTDTYQLNDEFVYVPLDIYEDGAYAIRCCGDSMSPEIEDGDVVVCSKTKPINGDIVHYKLHNEEAIKIYFKDEDSYTLQLIPYNKTDTFKTKIIRLDSEEAEELQANKVISIIKNNLNNRNARLRFAGVL